MKSASSWQFLKTKNSSIKVAGAAGAETDPYAPLIGMVDRTDKNPALFVTLDSPYERLKISGVEIRIRELGRRLNMDKIHPHKFRRTMATRAIDKGMPIEQVQKILGHSQIDTTMQYAIVNQNNVKTSHRRYIA